MLTEEIPLVESSNKDWPTRDEWLTGLAWLFIVAIVIYGLIAIYGDLLGDFSWPLPYLALGLGLFLCALAVAWEGFSFLKDEEVSLYTSEKVAIFALFAIPVFMVLRAWFVFT